MKFDPIIAPPPVSDLDDATVQQKRLVECEQKVTIVDTKNGQKVIWAIVSDLTLKDCCEMGLLVCDVFKRLGRHDVAEKIQQALREIE